MKAPIDCSMCKLHLQRTQVVQGSGNWARPKIMFIGAAPGKEEEDSGSQFIGGAGKVLRHHIREAGLLPEDCYFTTVCKCRPPNNRPPDMNEIVACQGFLKEEIKHVNPQVIIALGDIPTAVLAGKTGVHNWRGTLVSGQGPAAGYKVLITMDPMAVVKMRQMLPVFTQDIAKSIKEWPEIVENYLYDPTPGEAQLWFDKYRDEPLIGCDIETAEDKEEGGSKDALNPWRGNIIGISFCGAPGQAMAFTQGPLMIMKDMITKFLSEGKFVFANHLFDRSYCVVHGYGRPNNSWDVQDAIHLIHSGLPKKLDFLRSIYTNMEPYKMVYKNHRGKYRPGDLQKQDLGRLANLDTDATLRIALAQAEYVPPNLMQDMLDEGELALDMVLRGLCLDKMAMARHYARILPEIDRIGKWFTDTHGVHNPNSHVQINRLLYGKLGLPKYDDKGRKAWAKGSTNEKAVQAMSRSLGLVYYAADEEAGTPEYFEGEHQHKEVFSNLLTYRGLVKLKGTYCEGPFGRIESDGMLHPGWKPNGTGTGRWSCKVTPVQGWPEDQRDMIVAPEGYKIIGADYKGAQIIGAGILAGEHQLVADMLKPEYDIHETIRKEIQPHYPSIKRIQVKTVIFGTMFGRTVRDIAQTYGVSISTVNLWIGIFFASRPKLKDYFEVKIPEELKANGKIMLPDGRHIYCEKVTEAKASCPQNFESYVTKTAMKRLRRAGFWVCIMLHDAVYCYIRDDETFEQQFAEFGEIMATAGDKFIERFPCKPKQGYNWKEVS